MKQLLSCLILCCLACSSGVRANITINKYAAVLSRDVCSNSLTVDDATDLNIGDTVLMIQMKGADIDTSNSAGFGTILNYNGAGNYELNIIKAKAGNVVTLNYKIIRQYDIPKGKVQLVRVPYYQNYTVTQLHDVPDWDGNKGGVFAINVANTLTMNDKIDVSGKGFRGGQVTLSAQYSCNRTDYFYPATNNEGAKKGEGISTISTTKMYGRGCLANGAGGGNDHNSGGAGGGNGGTGGLGGNQYSFTPGPAPCGGNPVIANIGGVGGRDLAYNNASSKIFMGGGGGSGHGNNLTEKPGGNGGGIVFIWAGTIVGNNALIEANGSNAPECGGPGPGCSDDASGGGGGGGAILLRSGTYTGNINLVAKGGEGANAFLNQVISNQVGPGGGGGGGAIWFNQATIPTNTTTNAAAGSNGVLPQFANTSWGAQPGQIGHVLTGLQFNYPTDSFKRNIISVDFVDSTVTCLGRKFTDLSSVFTAGSISSWSWTFGSAGTSSNQHPTVIFPSAGSYTVKLVVTDVNGCKDSVTKTLIVTPQIITQVNASICPGGSYTFNTNIYSTAGIYADTFHNAGCDSISRLNLIINPVANTTISASICPGSSYNFNTQLLTAAGTYRDTLQTSGGCDSIITLQLSIVPVVTTNITAIICQDSSYMFGSTLLTDAGIYKDTLVSASGCDSIVTLTLTVSPKPVANFIFSPTVPIRNEPIHFTDQSINATSYFWSFGDNTTSLDKDPSHLFLSTGTFNVCLTVYNTTGCKDIICKKVSADVLFNADVPTAFSPNGDGHNDVLFVRGNGIATLSLRLFNRWGQLIFQSDDVAKGWDGTFNGKQQAIEVVAYTMEVTFLNGSTATKHGNITIVQ